MKTAVFIGHFSFFPGALSFGQTGACERLSEYAGRFSDAPDLGKRFDGRFIFLPHGQEKEIPYAVPAADLYFPR